MMDKARIQRETDILDRIDAVKRLIQMETTLLSEMSPRYWAHYRMVDKDGNPRGTDLLTELRDTIQLQLLSIVALCYGDNPDIGEPVPMLAWKQTESSCPEDDFREMMRKCLEWNA